VKGVLKLFGREPVAVISVAETILALILGLAHVDAEKIGVIMAVVTALAGLFNAWATYDTMLSAVVGLAKAAFALVIAFGFNLSDQLTGTLIMTVTVVLGLIYNRSATSPAVTPSFSTPDTVPGEIITNDPVASPAQLAGDS
jgi:hypothetical protein